MLVLYLYGKLLDKKDDYQFVDLWEKKLIPRTRYIILGLIVYFSLAVWLITTVLLLGSDSLFLSVMVFFLTIMVYGFYFLRRAFAFFAKNNSRYVLVKSGMQEDTFDKRNVVN